MTYTHNVFPVAVISNDEVEEHSNSLDTTLLFNVENHITVENRSFHDVENENDVPSRDFACDGVLDLTVCADI